MTAAAFEPTEFAAALAVARVEAEPGGGEVGLVPPTPWSPMGQA